MVKSIAIACQGGGSHTAFTAGVLKRILREQKEKFKVITISGTSGGAINALLVWYGLLKGGNDYEYGKEEAIRLLDDFWKANTANTPIEEFLNNLIMFPSNLKKYTTYFPILKMDLFCYYPNVEISPRCNFISGWSSLYLRNILENIVKFEDIQNYIKKFKESNLPCPELIVSAIDVKEGAFHIFKNKDITIDSILASAAWPILFDAVKFNGNTYWDGLFSQNPPIRDLVDDVDVKPEEIWIIQINPMKIKDTPESITDIRNRRNELTGNLSLYQELYFIHKVNEWIHNKIITEAKYKRIEVRGIILDRQMDCSSKLNRDPLFIAKLMKYGEKKADEFLKNPQSELYRYPYEHLRNILKTR